MSKQNKEILTQILNESLSQVKIEVEKIEQYLVRGGQGKKICKKVEAIGRLYRKMNYDAYQYKYEMDKD